MTGLQLRRVDPDRPEERVALQAVLAAAPGYSRAVYGHPPDGGEAARLAAELPPGKDLADKFVYGLWLDGKLVGCADLVRGFPDPATAYLGLLLLAEHHQGHGLGPQALRLLAREAVGWGCRSLRLSVAVGNPGAHRFWRREGFREVARRRLEGVTSPLLVMERDLPATPPATAVDG